MMRNRILLVIMLLMSSVTYSMAGTINPNAQDASIVYQNNTSISEDTDNIHYSTGEYAEPNDQSERLKDDYKTLLRPLITQYGQYVLIAGVLLIVLIIAVVVIITLFIVRQSRKKKKSQSTSVEIKKSEEPESQKRKKKKGPQPTSTIEKAPDNPAAQSEIIVRRKTTTILKKQNLGDVLHNDNYLKIDCQDFCNDSAVRRMYIKNTCIKDIYNMYADDLRNSDNPKENGCMVLGRWVYDDETDEYYVSLEYVVLPGDDAVFKEYELNFGGKIKLRVAEKLRRLRKDTDLQYDMTCWVHSHPGLGVFFSNSDNGVHMQLKHAMHPRFLTAIVVDILTPKMDMGIFTFKQGSELTVNSRQDITHLYSLEKMYQWALESDRSSFKQEDHYNVLSAAQERDESCDGIQLSNSSVIDICRFAENQSTDLIGFGHGYIHTHGIHTEYIVEEVSLNEQVPNHDMLGCIIVGTHLSLPSIQQTIGDFVNRCKFVMFYSFVRETLISIPILKGELVMDEKYFSEVKMEDLKIWTRRRR